jgi:hypothetical protein
MLRIYLSNLGTEVKYYNNIENSLKYELGKDLEIETDNPDMIVTCDCLMLFTGWEDNKQARAERVIAILLEIPIVFYNDKRLPDWKEAIKEMDSEQSKMERLKQKRIYERYCKD